MSETHQPSGPLSVKRRRLLAGAAVAGLGALVAVEVAKSKGLPVPAMSEPLADDVKLAHLLRRAGFGASPTEMEQYQQLGLSGTVDRLIDYDKIDNTALENRLKTYNLDPNKRGDIERWWLLRMIYTARPLEEKMTLFWHGLLTSAISKVGRAEPMFVQNQFLRTNALGDFPDILKGISKDPAMMVWLDLETNRKGHANENYARELMELFTMGVGHYTEQDVRESARAFTGWVVRRKRLGPKAFHFESFFAPRLHDDGTKTVLGQTGRFNGDDIVDIIMKQPATAHFITAKLFSYFVYPNPTDDVLQPFVNTFVASKYSIKALVKAILTSDAFYSPRAYRALIKSPAEFVAGTLRMLNAETNAIGLPYLMNQMGQELFNPPNVAGWPGGSAWLTSGTWLARLNFANRVVAALGPSSVIQQIASIRNGRPVSPNHVPVPTAGAKTPTEIVDHLLRQLLDGQINAAQRQVLVDHVAAHGTANKVIAMPWLDQGHRDALYLTLAMPEFHLA
jgi:uncharacterized protein (DUF1800 family)